MFSTSPVGNSLRHKSVYIRSFLFTYFEGPIWVKLRQGLFHDAFGVADDEGVMMMMMMRGMVIVIINGSLKGKNFWS